MKTLKTLEKPSALLPSPQEWGQLSSLLPSSSGVYLFLDKSKRVIYIGKAKNIKKRLYSYSTCLDGRPAVAHFLPRVQYTKIQPTPNEYIALLLEAELIRLHQPPANSRFKDDKSSLYIGITKESFPKIKTIRKQEIGQDLKQFSSTFGPFTSGYVVHQILKTMRRVLPFCSATDNQRRRKQPCFYVHLDLCPGICIGNVSIESYKTRINQIKLFLSGHHQILAKNMKSRIKIESDAQHFEAADQLKHQYQALRMLTHSAIPDLYTLFTKQTNPSQSLESLRRLLIKSINLPKEYPLNRIEMYDAANVQGKHATASLVVATDGVLDKKQYRHFSIQTTDTPNDPAMLREVIKRRFVHAEWPTPSVVFVDGGKTQINQARLVIPGNIPLLGLAKKPDRLIFKQSNNQWGSVDLKDQAFVPLITTLRNESHRFARKLFHYKLKKAYTNSP